MGRLSEYNREDQDILTLRSRFHSDSLPRVDKDLENWTIKLELSSNVVETLNSTHKRRNSETGGRVLPYKGSE